MATTNPLLQETTTLVNAALKKAKIDPKIKMQGFGPALAKVVYGVLKNGSQEQKEACNVTTVAKLAEYSIAKTSELYSDEGTKPFQFIVDLGRFRDHKLNPVANQAPLSDLRAVRREWNAGRSLPVEEPKIVQAKTRAPLEGPAKNMYDLQKKVAELVPLSPAITKNENKSALEQVQAVRGALFSLGYTGPASHLSSEQLQGLLNTFNADELITYAKLRRQYGKKAELTDLVAARSEFTAFSKQNETNIRKQEKKPSLSPSNPEI